MLCYAMLSYAMLCYAKLCLRPQQRKPRALVAEQREEAAAVVAQYGHHAHAAEPKHRIAHL